MDHRASFATYQARHPHATRKQWRDALHQANYQLRRKGLPEIEQQGDAPQVAFRDKKVGTTDWREVAAFVTTAQTLRHKGSWSQHTAKIEIATDESILLIPFSDAHIGSWGASLAQLVTLTDEVLTNPRIYLGFVGDLINLAIRLRGVLEVKDDLLPPDMQHNFMESWLAEIAPKVLFAGWGNHDSEREEDGAGASIHKRMLERRVPYFAGIGHVDLSIGAEVYRLALSHRFRGSTTLNVLGGQKRYARFEAPDREILLGGDLHRPAYESYYDGAQRRVALNCGALQTGSGYAQRYFSLYTIPEYPVIELYPDEHRAIPYANIGDWQATLKRKAA